MEIDQIGDIPKNTPAYKLGKMSIKIDYQIISARIEHLFRFMELSHKRKVVG